MKNINILLIIGIICFVISKYIISICIVHGRSMSPTYKDNDIVLESKIINNINRDDIVVIYKNNTKIIKRVIGCPYDILVIKDGYMYINNIKYNDTYISYSGILDKEVILNEDEYFVMGDNVNNSIDSRFNEIGIIKTKEIKGKVIWG